MDLLKISGKNKRSTTKRATSSIWGNDSSLRSNTFKRTMKETEDIKKTRSWTDALRNQNAKDRKAEEKNVKKVQAMMRFYLSIHPINQMTTHEIKCMAEKLRIPVDGGRKLLLKRITALVDESGNGDSSGKPRLKNDPSATIWGKHMRHGRRGGKP